MFLLEIDPTRPLNRSLVLRNFSNLAASSSINLVRRNRWHRLSQPRTSSVISRSEILASLVAHRLAKHITEERLPISSMTYMSHLSSRATETLRMSQEIHSAKIMLATEVVWFKASRALQADPNSWKWLSKNKDTLHSVVIAWAATLANESTCRQQKYKVDIHNRIY